MSKEIKVGQLKKGLKVVKLKAVANEHYVVVDDSGKAINKLKFVQKDKNLEVYAEVDGKAEKIVEIENYYAENMNCQIVGLDENEEIGYIYNSNDNWWYLADDTALGFFLTPLGIGAGVVGATGVGVAIANDDDNDSTSNNSDDNPISLSKPVVVSTLNVSDSDNDWNLIASGVTQPGSTVTITWPDGTTTNVVADSEGKYEAISPTVQPNGNVSAVITDSNGNPISNITTPYADTTAPITPILNVSDSDNDGKINVSGIAEPKSTVTITWPDGTTSTVVTDPVSGAYSVESPTVQPSGEIKATVTDVNGNVSDDMMALMIPTVNTTTSTDNTPVITGTAILGSGETLSVTVNGATYDNVTVTAGTWSIDTATAVVSSGTLGAFVDAQQYAVSAIIKDTYGNTSTDISTNEVTIDIPKPPVLTSTQSLDAVSNLDVKSALVLSFDQGITLGSGHIKIYDDMGTLGWNHVNSTTGESIRDTYDNDVDITLTNGAITAVTIGGVDYTSRFDLANSVTTVGNNLVIDLKQAVASQAGGTGSVSPYSIAFDWDFGSNYHVNFDAGVVKSSTNPSLTNAALSDSTTLNFTTVTPANDSIGALSQKMDGTGVSTALSNSTYWVNGNQSANDGAHGKTVIDLAGKDVQVVLDSNGGNGVGSTDGNLQTYVQLNNFARGDNLYLSNHGDMSMATTDGISAANWSIGTYRNIGDAGSTGGTGQVWIYKDAGTTTFSPVSQDAQFELTTSNWGGTAYNAIIFG